jgi:hypothetical protein
MGYIDYFIPFPKQSTLPTPKEFCHALCEHTGLTFDLKIDIWTENSDESITNLMFYHRKFPDWNECRLSILPDYGILLVSSLPKTGYLWFSILYLMVKYALQENISTIEVLHEEDSLKEFNRQIPYWAKHPFVKAKKMKGFVLYDGETAQEKVIKKTY